ncbi:unnamed protein product [Periconia digitata]|uniref:Wings apart-like protein C-terminal domain-containing protein n=1 Tax=Periconia digitata TaxID=1303443 RepID=A0A9W4UCD0_9PLEO|nr:unnamed protein product [Periconia digitata]
MAWACANPLSLGACEGTWLPATNNPQRNHHRPSRTTRVLATYTPLPLPLNRPQTTSQSRTTTTHSDSCVLFHHSCHRRCDPQPKHRVTTTPSHLFGPQHAPMSRIYEPNISHSEMAMPLPSTFSAPERRKKVTTYGRPGRHPSTAKFFADTPSPERPRKQPKTVYAAVRKPAPSIEIQGTLTQNYRRQSKSPAPLDIFDVPSDHEATSAAPPVPPAGHRRRIPPKSEDPSVFDILSSNDDDDGIQPARKTAKQALISSNRKPVASLEPVHKKSILAQSGAKQIVADGNNTVNPSAARKRAKTPQVAQELPPVEQKQPITRTTRSRATTPALPNLTSQVKHNPAISNSSKPTVKKSTTANKPSTIDIFDVPSSDESEPHHATVKSRTASVTKRNVTTTASHIQTPLSPTPSMESDVSQKSNKRKRRASVSSSATVRASAIEQKPRESNSQRERKHQKKMSDTSAGMPSILTSRPNPSIVNTKGVSAINEPKRTRIRTAPVKPRAPVIKGQSSPAKLHTMLVHRTAPNQSRVKQVPQAPESDAMEDDTMCEPQSTKTPPTRTLKTHGSGSVTPRQQALFSNLLGDSSDSATPMPKLSDLKISERKPSPAITNLMRSVSDIPQSAHTRKTRLLDVLKRTASSSEEESETDEETEDEIVSIPQASVSKTNSRGGGSEPQLALTDTADAMDIDTEPIGDSQTSQTSIHLHTGGRITYAKNRSYLEDTEPDLANLLDNMDDDLGLVLPKNQEVESDVDDEGGHLRDIHDLRRQGQQHKFQAQAEATIEEVAGKGLNASQRRSAMMECATQMKDKNYVSQLLESSLMSSLIQSISSTGEIIFDFAAATAVLFILEVRPGYAVLEQIHQSAITGTLGLLLSSKHCSMDIHRISKERKTNMAPRARETVAEFRGLILDSNFSNF